MKRHRFYDEIQSLLNLKNFWKEIFMNFITDLSLNKWKNNVYNTILMIINRYIKMIQYILTIKILIASDLINLFFKEIALRFKISEKIVTNKENLFTSVF